MSNPMIVDDDASMISVVFEDREVQAWFYADEPQRREKMRYAHYFCDGFICARNEIAPDESQQEPSSAEIASMRALYEGEKRAGLLDSKEEYEAKMRDAGRGHLLGN